MNQLSLCRCSVLTSPIYVRRGGKFIFDFTISPSYPHEAPKVLCLTKVRPNYARMMSKGHALSFPLFYLSTAQHMIYRAQCGEPVKLCSGVESWRIDGSFP